MRSGRVGSVSQRVTGRGLGETGVLCALYVQTSFGGGGADLQTEIEKKKKNHRRDVQYQCWLVGLIDWLLDLMLYVLGSESVGWYYYC